MSVVFVVPLLMVPVFLLWRSPKALPIAPVLLDCSMGIHVAGCHITSLCCILRHRPFLCMHSSHWSASTLELQVRMQTQRWWAAQAAALLGPRLEMMMMMMILMMMLMMMLI